VSGLGVDDVLQLLAGLFLLAVGYAATDARRRVSLSRLRGLR